MGGKPLEITHVESQL